MRFIRVTDILSITTIPRVVVMLLLFTVACSKEVKEVVDATYDPEKSYTMKATQVNTLISDSGITRYRIEAAEWGSVHRAGSCGDFRAGAARYNRGGIWARAPAEATGSPLCGSGRRGRRSQ